MRPIHLLALACVLAAALIGVLLLADSGAAGAPTTLEAAERAPAAHPDELATQAGEADASGDTARSVAAAAQDAAPAPASSASAERGVRLIAVTGAARREVELEQWWWWPAPATQRPPRPETFDELLQSCRLDALLPERAQRLVPDEQGRVYAPAARVEGTVVALGSGLFGRTSIGSNSADPTLIECEPDKTLDVRVVDGSGAPVAGVRVALRQHYQGVRFVDHGVAQTDEQGRARLPHYRALIDGDWDFSARYSVAIAEPLAAEVARVIDVCAPPAELVELVLPPVGSVAVEFEGLEPDAYVGLELVALDFRPSDEDEGRFGDGRRRASQGRVLFPFVGLGRDVIAWSEDVLGERSYDAQRRRGPVRAGELVSLRIRSEGEPTKLTGRVVDAAGAPLPRAWSNLHITYRSGDDGRTTIREHVRCDEAGRFEATLASRWPEADFHVDVVRADGRRLESAKLTLSASPAAGPLELGDIRVVDVPLLIAGKVVDRTGAPVPYASVHALERRERARSNGGIDVTWRAVGSQVRANARGEFALQGGCESTRLLLNAEAEGRRASPTWVSRGARDAVVVIDCDCELPGRLLLGELTPPDFVYVAAQPRARATADQPPHEERTAFVDEHGEFVVRGLAPGEHDLIVHHKGRGIPLARVERVLAAEGNARDSRLDPLDLRGLWDLVLVEVFGPDGKALQDVSEYRGPSGASRGCEEDWHSGERLMLDRSAPPLWLAAEECAFVQVFPASVGPRLDFPPAPRVRVRLDEALPALPEGVGLALSITSPGEPAWLGECFPDELDFGAKRAFEGRVRRVGLLSATLWIHGSESLSLPASFVGGARTVATSELAEFVLSCEPKAFAEALERVR